MSGQIYKVFCLSERKIVYGWGISPLTECPNSTHHDIETASVRVADDYVDSFKATENTTGDYTMETITNNIPSGSIGDITLHDDSKWDNINIFLWKTTLFPNSSMIGDVINVRGIKGPGVDDNVVGVLTAPANINDTVLNVNSTVIDNVYIGLEVELDDGVTKENVGIIISIDTVNSTITVKLPLVNAFPAGTTKIRVEVVIIKNLFIQTDKHPIVIGGKGLKGKNVDMGDIMRVKYTNNDGLAKTIYWNAEYYNKASGA